jgi:3'(2'), 5'-bisphosphate nucleotidase
MTKPSTDDHRDAAAIANDAGRVLLELRASGLPTDQLKAAGDARSQQCIAAALRLRHPKDAVLSEEAADDDARLSSTRVWIVDPLDGTREYGEVPRTDWAVHVALVVEGDLAAGAVALPARGITLSTAEPRRTPAPTDAPIRLVVSRTRPTEHATALADVLGAELVPMGSAGAKVAAVVLGDADVYAHTGGQYEWDSAAPVAVAAAAGLHTSRFDGSPLRYNQPDPWLPDLLVCRPDLARTVLGAIRRLGE